MHTVLPPLKLGITFTWRTTVNPLSIPCLSDKGFMRELKTRAALVWRISDKTRFRKSSRLHRLVQVRVAEWLDSLGFDVYLEEPLEGDLVADVYAESPWATLIVEVETGFVAPGSLERAEEYLAGKALAKASRYSPYADIFAVATPSYIKIPIPPELYKSGGEAALMGYLRRFASLAGNNLGVSVRIDALLEVSLARREVMVTPISSRGKLLLDTILL